MGNELSPTSTLIREVAFEAARDNPLVMVLAQQWAREVHGLSVEGALEVFFRVYLMMERYDGHAKEMAAFTAALDRMRLYEDDMQDLRLLVNALERAKSRQGGNGVTR